MTAAPPALAKLVPTGLGEEVWEEVFPLSCITFILFVLLIPFTSEFPGNPTSSFAPGSFCADAVVSGSCASAVW